MKEVIFYGAVHNERAIDLVKKTGGGNGVGRH